MVKGTVAYFLLLCICYLADRVHFCNGMPQLPLGIIIKRTSTSDDIKIRAMQGDELLTREENFVIQVNAYFRDPANNLLPIARTTYEQQHINSIIRQKVIQASI